MNISNALNRLNLEELYKAPQCDEATPPSAPPNSPTGQPAEPKASSSTPLTGRKRPTEDHHLAPDSKRVRK